MSSPKIFVEYPVAGKFFQNTERKSVVCGCHDKEFPTSMETTSPSKRDGAVIKGNWLQTNGSKRLLRTYNFQMSWDNRSPGDLSSSQGSRPSNTLARLAFNIYGNSGSSSAGSLPSRAPAFTPSSRHSPPNGLTPVYEGDPKDTSRVRYRAGFELTAFCKLNNEQDSAVIAGKNALQVLRIGQQITLTEDLLAGNSAMKNKKLIGSILDVKAGYQNCSKYIATSTTTGSILMFNTESSKKLLYKFSDHTRAVNSIAFNQLDGSALISGSQDGAMKLWDLRSSTGKAVLTMHGSSDAVRSLQFSPFHNKKLAAIFDSGVIQKWDLRVPGQYEKRFNAHTGPGLSLDWHPELDYIVSGGRDKQVQIWNMSSNETRLPEHVIYTASPVSKVAFRPGPINNIKDAEIASSFLNNELGVQVYALRRKYIPLYTVESHSAQITGLYFKDDRYLWTASKDKYFVKQDLYNQPMTIDNLPLSSVSWAPNNDLMFVDQQKIPIEFDHSNTMENHMSTTAPSTSPSSSSMALLSPAVQSFSEMSPRPGMSRTSSFRPPLTRNHSHGSNYHQHIIASTPVMNPYAIPVNLPIMKTNDVLKFLTDNYVFDDSKDFIESCERNAHVASQVGNHRDAQTWNVIKESLQWESNLEGQQKYDEPIEPYIDENDSMRSDSIHEKYRYSASNSTGYSGKSPSLSDLSEFNSSLNSRDASFSDREKTKKQMQPHRFSGIEESGEESEVDEGSTPVKREDVIKWADALHPTQPSPVTDHNNHTTDDNEEAIEFTDSVAKPINQQQRKRSNRNSLLEAILHPETSPGGKSASPTYSLSSSMSAASQVRTYTQSFVPLMQKQKLINKNSHMSMLTKQLTNQNDDQKETELLPPFAPRIMIHKAVEFSAGQGDLIMSCTLLLLFNEKYKIYKDGMMKSFLYSYLEFLQRLRFWTTFTKLIRASKYDDLKQMSSNSTSVRRFCGDCGVCVVNEATKEKFMTDSAVEYGAWFCERCSNRMKCIYCNEPVKGLNVFRLKCGHSGHFGCLQTWVLDEKMDCCPGGCIP